MVKTTVEGYPIVIARVCEGREGRLEERVNILLNLSNVAGADLFQDRS